MSTNLRRGSALLRPFKVACQEVEESAPATAEGKGLNTPDYFPFGNRIFAYDLGFPSQMHSPPLGLCRKLHLVSSSLSVSHESLVGCCTSLCRLSKDFLWQSSFL